MEQVSATLLPFLDGTTVLRADYKRQAFSLHSHPTYVIASITSGALRFRCEDDIFVAPTGAVCLINPHEVQTGEAATAGGWSYWSAYVPASVFEAIGEALLPGRRRPIFRTHVLDDGGVKRAVDGFFRCAQQVRSSLGRTEALLSCLSDLTECCCDNKPSSSERLETQLVRSAKDYMAGKFAEDLQLEDVAVAFGVTGFHLTRSFKRSTGLAMHAWLVQHRVERARAMLIRGTALAEAAASCGFSDQPHMTRWFRRMLGMTPREVQRMSRTFKTAPPPAT
jgi:AraC-like DNA-binding protein